jgi:division protein CdvB (Snf7/Vps24/ESCRT-III family)
METSYTYININDELYRYKYRLQDAEKMELPNKSNDYGVSFRLMEDIYMLQESIFQLDKQQEALNLRIEILKNQLLEFVDKTYIIQKR